MKITRIAAATAALALGAGIAASPAMAYDTGAYSYAAGHQIHRSDIPKILGAFKPALAFNAYGGSSANTLCDVPQSDPNAPDDWVKYPSGDFSWNANYNGKGKDAPSVSVQISQYATSQKAIAAFNTIKKRIDKCTGTGSNTWTGDDGTSTTYSTEVTHGVVPQVTTVGVESLFVSNNSLSESTPGDSKYVNDQYSVFSLVNDVILETTYFSNTNTNLTTKQRKAVDQVAFNAETRWLG